ncbi:beta-N-acetylhexosaminidase [Stakelama pacifica]|uniref:beta-N-acetylhexosaminidase n=1 Tax=Stakelama pacifica TaxID=517720 RepID=A0A4R6FTS2_9SPHN|nr:beta-N-acetylhexosaminidase [Stakelama pacifica]TDN84600.1 beta-N-acetylhexosaminidase [Stakelama pacifica]GGO93329.1 glycosyl hydrolase [Stakelama pacifica]
MKPVIHALSGTSLTADERSFFADSDPAGYILFRRNVENREQLRALTDSLRALAGRDDLPILIDQEGGRVARMQPPEWPAFPAPAVFSRLYDIAPASAIEAARVNAQALGLMLSEVGINVDALPLLDIVRPETSNAIGDRALGDEPLRVAALGRATIDGLRKGGVVGIVKHMPGHGRAVVDSHKELPVVDAPADALETDIAPFATLKDAPMGMTAHVVYRAWDENRPATLSPTVISEIIRDRIGFTGLLMSDDLDMKALSGSAGEKAAGAIAAGCDLALECWARMEEMVDIAAALGEITPESRERLSRAMATIADGPEDADFAELIAKRDTLLALS